MAVILSAGVILSGGGGGGGGHLTVSIQHHNGYSKL